MVLTDANLGTVVRLASCYALRQVWFTGDRVWLDLNNGLRLPCQERMMKLSVKGTG
jgi:hypothetical protein